MPGHPWRRVPAEEQSMKLLTCWYCFVPKVGAVETGVFSLALGLEACESPMAARDGSLRELGRHRLAGVKS